MNWKIKSLNFSRQNCCFSTLFHRFNKTFHFLTSFLTLKCIAMSTVFAKMQMSCPTIIIVLFSFFVSSSFFWWWCFVVRTRRKRLTKKSATAFARRLKVLEIPLFFRMSNKCKKGEQEEKLRSRETKKCVVQLIHPPNIILDCVNYKERDLIFLRLSKAHKPKGNFWIDKCHKKLSHFSILLCPSIAFSEIWNVNFSLVS